MVDRVLEVEPRVRAVAQKDVLASEDWARGHFPGNPVFPGVLMAEAMAQVAAVAFLVSVDDPGSMMVFLAGIDKLRVRRVVVPGDTLTMEVTVTRQRGKLWFFEGRMTNQDGDRVSDGAFFAAIEERGS